MIKMISYLTCQVRNNNLQYLKPCIRATVAVVTHNILKSLWTEVRYLDIFHAIRSAYFEITQVVSGQETSRVFLCKYANYIFIMSRF